MFNINIVKSKVLKSYKKLVADLEILETSKVNEVACNSSLAYF
jgi:hypothetical protein